jgi:hypothetical protein
VITPLPDPSPAAFPTPDIGMTPTAFYTMVYNWVMPEVLATSAAVVGISLFALLIRRVTRGG